MARGKKKETLTPEERLQAALVPESEQPYKVPGNWCWCLLGKVVFIRRGASPRPIKAYITENEDGVNWIKIGDTNGGKYITYVNEKITDTGAQKSVFVEEGTLLLSNSMSFGRPYILKVKGCIHDGWLALTPSEVIDKEYLYYALLASEWYFEQVAVGTAVRNLNSERVAGTPLPLPPLPEQQRIVDRIESLFAKLDEAKQKAQDALDSFETRKAAILHKAFTGELIGKHSAATTTLEEITTCIRIGPFGSALHKEDYILGGVPVVNPKHIVQQKIVPEEKTTVSVLKAEELSSYILQKNDIILGRRGDMGRSAPVTDLETGWLCGTGSMIIRLKSGYNAKFYSQIIASQAAVRYLEENSVGSTMKNLNEKVVRLLPIPDFTVDEQLEIVRILDNLLAKEQQAKEVAEKVLEQIDLIKKAILARAFRGELGTNDPSEENAKELLSSEI